MPLECRLTDLSAGSATGRVLTADEMNAHNTFTAPNALQPVAFEGVVIEDSVLQLTLPAKSIVVLEINPALP